MVVLMSVMSGPLVHGRAPSAGFLPRSRGFGMKESAGVFPNTMATILQVCELLSDALAQTDVVRYENHERNAFFHSRFRRHHPFWFPQRQSQRESRKSGGSLPFRSHPL